MYFGRHRRGAVDEGETISLLETHSVELFWVTELQRRFWNEEEVETSVREWQRKH